jgi:hypothetical protein
MADSWMRHLSHKVRFRFLAHCCVAPDPGWFVFSGQLDGSSWMVRNCSKFYGASLLDHAWFAVAAWLIRVRFVGGSRLDCSLLLLVFLASGSQAARVWSAVGSLVARGCNGW